MLDFAPPLATGRPSYAALDQFYLKPSGEGGKEGEKVGRRAGVNREPAHRGAVGRSAAGARPYASCLLHFLQRLS